jgi:hypothetical protein
MIATGAARAGIAAVGLLLLWRALQVNAVVYEDANRPAFRMPQNEAARPAALRAEVTANPGSVPALVHLAAEREAAGDGAAATRILQTALAIAPIDRHALQAAAALDARAQQPAQALTRVDHLLSYYGDTRGELFPLLTQWITVPEARAGLEALAARPSSWMGAFVLHACARSDPQLVAAVHARRAASGQARTEETRCVIDALRRAGHWPAAYQAWLNSLPRDRLADVGFVFNGSFEHAPSTLGFDWMHDTRSPAFSADFPAAPGVSGNRALRVNWNGKRATGPAVHQYLALDPGRYELTGLARMEGLQSVRGVQWSIRCADTAQRPLAASPRFMGSGEWQRFAAAVEIPPGCPGQVLQLEPAGMQEGTTFVSGKAWFDDMRLTRSN